MVSPFLSWHVGAASAAGAFSSAAATVMAIIHRRMACLLNEPNLANNTIDARFPANRAFLPAATRISPVPPIKEGRPVADRPSIVKPRSGRTAGRRVKRRESRHKQGSRSLTPTTADEDNETLD